MSDEAVHFVDTGLRADRVLTMIAAILLNRHGSVVEFDEDEWRSLNRLYDGDAAVLYEKMVDDTGRISYRAQIGTTGSIVQGLPKHEQPN